MEVNTKVNKNIFFVHTKTMSVSDEVVGETKTGNSQFL
jgi:hypothetical protein